MNPAPDEKGHRLDSRIFTGACACRLRRRRQAGGSGDDDRQRRPDAAARSVATGMVAAQYETLMAANDPQVWQKLRGYVLTQPEFTEAGLGDGLLWVRFSDGRYFMYLAARQLRETPLSTETTSAKVGYKNSAAFQKGIQAHHGRSARGIPQASSAALIAVAGWTRHP